ncbi:MAG: tetratricopeptide repeat protein [Tardiphaga sp.]
MTAAVELMLREAAEHYANGRPDSAGALCADILRLRPDCIPALHLAAVVALSGGRMADGTELLGKIFLLDADYVPALATLGDAFAVKGERDGAVATFQRALKLRPLDAGIHGKLGAALVDAERLDDAVSIYQSALALDPDHVQIRFKLAICLVATGRVAEAEEAFSVVVERDPAHSGAWLRLGNLLADRHQVDKAIASYRRALQGDPNNLSAHAALGEALHRRGGLDDAIVHYCAVVELAPNDAGGLRRLAFALHEAGRLQQAVDAYRRFIALNATDIEISNNLCACLIDLGQLDAASVAADRALALDPRSANAHVNLGVILERQGQAEAAIACYRRAIAADPHDDKGYANLAVALRGVGDLDAALAAAQQAVALAPAHPLLLANLSGILHNRGDVDEALAISHRAVALAPELPSVRYNHAHLLLLCGDLKNGFAEYRLRRRCIKTVPTIDGAEWQGEPLAGRTLLLWSEQGLGDTLQFIRYLPMLAAADGRIVLQVQPALVSLLSSLRGVTVVSRDAPLPPFDLQLPLMDLPYVFGTTLDSIPADVPYLSADPDKAATWHRALRDSGALKVGVVWAGSPTHSGDRYRSLSAEAVLPHLIMPGVQLYSLQKEPRAADAPVLARLGAAIADLAPRLGDFSDTAAAISALDLVISVDTSVVHLAGAMGRPTWLMLPYAQDWRWLRDREDTPWYPSMRLFRQKTPQAWSGVVAHLSTELAGVVAAASIAA